MQDIITELRKHAALTAKAADLLESINKPVETPHSTIVEKVTVIGRKKMSPAARARIAQAQRERWAKWKRQNRRAA